MTDVSARRRGPLLTLTSIEWKLLRTATLSAVYTYTVIAVSRPAPDAAASALAPAVSVAAPTPSSRVAPVTSAPSAVTSSTAPRAAQPRIRTRSS